MPSFIHSQRHNIDRLVALILLWNVVAGLFVTLGAPWLADIARATNLRSASALPAGSGWLAFGVPTHFAGIWLSALGGYALYRARRRLQWHLTAALFYAAQTFAITSPLHVDMWIGVFAATSFQSIAVNWIAVALFLIHVALGLERKPLVTLELAREFWGAAPLSRTALSRRYATIATIAAIALLPLVPADAFYSSQHATPWRLLLLLPMTFVAAYVVAFVWSGGQREPRFSTGRGLTASLLSYVYLAMAADLLSRWLSNGQEPLFRLFLLAWIFLLPLILIVPVTGALAGAWLGRNVAAPQESNERRSLRLTSGMWLTLAMPLLALLLSYALGSSQRNRIETARVVALRALAHFDRNESEQLYAMFTTDSLAMIDRDSFIGTLKERRNSLGDLRSSDARRELRYQWFPRAEVIQFDFSRAGTKSESSESIVVDVHDSAPTLSAVFMTFDGQPPAHNVFMPRRSCGGSNELLHCGRFDDQAPRSLF